MRQHEWPKNSKCFPCTSKLLADGTCPKCLNIVSLSSWLFRKLPELPVVEALRIILQWLHGQAGEQASGDRDHHGQEHSEDLVEHTADVVWIPRVCLWEQSDEDPDDAAQEARHTMQIVDAASVVKADLVMQERLYIHVTQGAHEPARSTDEQCCDGSHIEVRGCPDGHA